MALRTALPAPLPLASQDTSPLLGPTHTGWFSISSEVAPSAPHEILEEEPRWRAVAGKNAAAVFPDTQKESTSVKDQSRKIAESMDFAEFILNGALMELAHISSINQHGDSHSLLGKRRLEK